MTATLQKRLAFPPRFRRGLPGSIASKFYRYLETPQAQCNQTVTNHSHFCPAPPSAPAPVVLNLPAGPSPPSEPRTVPTPKSEGKKRPGKRRSRGEQEEAPPPDALARDAETATDDNWWNIPPSISLIYTEARGIVKVHDWQKACLNNKKLLAGGNVVVAAPTSGGKSLIAEICILRTCCVAGKKCLFVMPYVALVAEKCREMESFKAAGIRVEPYSANKGPIPLPNHQRLLAVATVEKATGVMTSLLAENRIRELGLVVIDEMHMVAEANRGIHLEVLVANVRLAVEKGCNIQIVGMSATIPNMDQVAQWINGYPYVDSTRPVQLDEHYVNTYTREVFLKDGNPQGSGSDRDLCIYTSPTKDQIAAQGQHIPWGQPNAVAELSLETLRKNSGGILVFCSSKAETERFALKLKPLLEQAMAENNIEVSGAIRQHRDMAKGQLKTGFNWSPELLGCIGVGVAFHNASLSTRERQLIEKLFRDKVINIICCTTTLAAGVNLPAAKVFVTSTKTGGADLSVGQYRQMVGRAGRFGMVAKGQSYFFVKTKAEVTNVTTSYIHSTLGNVKSTMIGNLRTEKTWISNGLSTLNLDFFVLQLIGCNQVTDRATLRTALSYTLLYSQHSSEQILAEETACVARLQKEQFVEVSVIEADGREMLALTNFGKASFASHYSIASAISMKQSLERARKHMDQSEVLHALYFLVSPQSQQRIPEDYCEKIYVEFIGADASEKSVADRINCGPCTRLTLAWILKWRYMPPMTPIPVNICEMLRILHRKFDNLEALRDDSSMAGALAVIYCRQMGWQWGPTSRWLEVHLEQLQPQLSPEAAALCEISGIGEKRALMLCQAGYPTVKSISVARPEDLQAKVPGLSPLPHKLLGICRTLVAKAKAVMENKVAAALRDAKLMKERVQAAREDAAVPSPASGGSPSVPANPPEFEVDEDSEFWWEVTDQDHRFI